IETVDGYSVTLVHLGSAAVARGARVEEGAVIGAIGTSGTPEHPDPYVHMGVRTTADPNGYLDPVALLPSRPEPTTNRRLAAPARPGSRPRPPPPPAPSPTEAPAAPPAATAPAPTEIAAEPGPEGVSETSQPAPVVVAAEPQSGPALPESRADAP